MESLFILMCFLAGWIIWKLPAFLQRIQDFQIEHSDVVFGQVTKIIKKHVETSIEDGSKSHTYYFNVPKVQYQYALSSDKQQQQEQATYEMIGKFNAKKKGITEGSQIQVYVWKENPKVALLDPKITKDMQQWQWFSQLMSMMLIGFGLFLGYKTYQETGGFPLMSEGLSNTLKQVISGEKSMDVFMLFDVAMGFFGVYMLIAMYFIIRGISRKVNMAIENKDTQGMFGKGNETATLVETIQESH